MYRTYYKGKPLCTYSNREIEFFLKTQTTIPTVSIDKECKTIKKDEGYKRRDIEAIKRVALIETFIEKEKRTKYVSHLSEYILFDKEGGATFEKLALFCKTVEDLPCVLIYTPTDDDDVRGMEEIIRILHIDFPTFRRVVVNYIFDDIEGTLEDEHWQMVYFAGACAEDAQEARGDRYADLINCTGCVFQKEDETIENFALSICNI